MPARPYGCRLEAVGSSGRVVWPGPRRQARGCRPCRRLGRSSGWMCMLVGRSRQCLTAARRGAGRASDRLSDPPAHEPDHASLHLPATAPEPNADRLRSGAEQAVRVAPVGPDVILRRPSDLARRRNHTPNPALLKRPREPEPDRPSHIRRDHRRRQPTQNSTIAAVTPDSRRTASSPGRLIHRRRDDPRRMHIQTGEAPRAVVARARGRRPRLDHLQPVRWRNELVHRPGRGSCAQGRTRCRWRSPPNGGP